MVFNESNLHTVKSVLCTVLFDDLSPDITHATKRILRNKNVSATLVIIIFYNLQPPGPPLQPQDNSPNIQRVYTSLLGARNESGLIGCERNTVHLVALVELE
jgi:hypothetical protein